MSSPRWGLQFLISYAFFLSVVCGLLTVATALASAQSDVLHRFHGEDGQFPYLGNLLIDNGGNIYGTTYYGGDLNGGCGYGCGTVFKLTPENGGWTETVLHKFQDDGEDGYFPLGTLAIDGAGNLYGITTQGGASRVGTVFMLAPTAEGSYSETILYSFCSVNDCLDGAGPESGLALDARGNLYGTTSYGGDVYGGVVFKLSSPGGSGSWKETVLYSLLGTYEGGSSAGVIFDRAGNLYGTTNGGSSCFSGGTVFRLSPRRRGDWYYTLLYKFSQDGKDGACPFSAITLDPQGNIYGTTVYGGLYGAGVVYELVPKKHGPWKEHVVHNFNFNDGAGPYAGLVRDATGNLYGTLTAGGQGGLGSIFMLTPTKHSEFATEKILLNFHGKDGIFPYTGLTFDAAGNLYGAAYYGGDLGGCNNQGCGVVFKLTP